METKTLPFTPTVKAGGQGDPGSFEGYASRWYDVDSYGDTIDPGAYAETIPQFKTAGFISWSHDWGNPIATPDDVHEDAVGLFLSAEFHSHQVAQQARTITAERLARGKSMGLSIGYEALAWETRTVPTPYRTSWGELTDKVRALTKIKLYEVSLVSVPAQTSATVTTAKTGGGAAGLADAAATIAAMGHLMREAKAAAALGAKDGRVLSDANRRRVSGLVEALDGIEPLLSDLRALLDETDPNKQRAAKQELVQLRAAFQRTVGLELYQDYQRVIQRIGQAA